ncbi:ComEC/Rec2 family competence protein [Luedemannella flava]
MTGGLLLGAVTVALLVATAWRAPRRLALVVAVGAVLGGLPVRVFATGWPPPGALVVACDVGQGDAIVLPVAPGSAVVVDAGPDPSRVDACLRGLRVERIELLVLSHFHADHVDGLDGVLRGRQLVAAALPALAEPADRAAAVRARLGGASVLTPGPGWRRSWPGLTLTVLGPVRPLAGTDSDPNNNSLVLRADAGGVRILLTGDAETDEQRDLLAAGAGEVRADVLKVAHHGSAAQAERLIDAVAPRVALVSVGADNRYGHPNPGLMARLQRSGARILRTDTSGDLAVVAVDGGSGGHPFVHRRWSVDRRGWSVDRRTGSVNWSETQ